ncbi:DUF177 domain-containing protein [Myxococcota bacterium]|nr:DUF177 domain-containing protein [Myxococcota bacterium]
MTREAHSRQLTVTETLDLRQLPDDGLEYDETLEVPWIEAQLVGEDEPDETAVHARGPGRAKLEVRPLGPVVTRPPIRVRGDVSAPIVMTCVRCLSPVDDELAAHIDATLLASEDPALTASPDGEDGDLDPSAGADEGAYTGNAIDLPGILREALLLELSMSPMCEDQEACTGRTDALLRDANKAAEGVIVDDRWAALRKLRDAQGEEGSGNQG